MVEYVVEYNYDAVHDDELTIRVGEIIRNVKKLEEEGWLEGELNGKRGMFPDNFVKEVKRETESKEDGLPVKRERHGNVANLVQRMSTYGFPTGAFQPQSKGFRRRSKKRPCKVLFEYTPQNEDELELKVGDIVDMNEEVEEGWWSGTLNGKTGLFPSNFVKELEITDDGEIQESLEDTESVFHGPQSPATSPGNGSESPQIAQPKKIRGVGFGDIFKEGSVKLKPRLSSNDSEEKKQDKPLPNLPSGPKVTSLPGTTKSEMATEIAKIEMESKQKPKEYCKTLFAYEGSHEDELNFKEGDIIQIINKDTGEEGWWRGFLNGKEGVFPDNFAVQIHESDKDFPKPKKPPPPAKCQAAGSKADLLPVEKKFPHLRIEEKDEKPVLDQKTSKPVAPRVPPKKPVPPNKTNSLLKAGVLLSKWPDKTVLQPPVSKINGEIASWRPKSEIEPAVKPKIDSEQLPLKSKSVEVDSAALRNLKEIELLSFDDLTPTSDNLSHPTANRPKMPGRRLPTRFNGNNPPAQTQNIEKNVKVHKEEEESAKLKLSESKKPSKLTSPVLTSLPRPSSIVINAGEVKLSQETDEGEKHSLEELRSQIFDLLLAVEDLKKEHGKQLEKLKKDLEEEKQMRSNLEMEIEKLKKAVITT